MEEKRIIAIIDYEDEFRDEFSITLEKLSLSEKYELILLVNELKSSTTREDMVKQCVSKLQELKKSLVAIMIDFVIFETAPKFETAQKKEIDLTGIEIVKDIRIAFPNLPIFLITKHIQAPKEKAFQFLPMLVFGSLEDVDGIMIKQYLCNVAEYTGLFPFRKVDFEEMINKARAKRNAYSTSSILLLSKDNEEKSSEELERLFKPDVRSNLQIKEIGSTIIKHLIIGLFPDGRGTISYFRPGFSGSYLFRVDTNSDIHNSWILKLNETEKIERELNNYKQIKKIIGEENYPYLVKEFVSYGRWSAFAVAREREAVTLFDYLNSSTLEKRKLEEILERIPGVTEKIANILKKIYGEQTRTSSRLWKDHCKFSRKTYLGLGAFFDEQETLLKKFCGDDRIDFIRSFVDSEGRSLSSIYEEPHWIYTGNIHGDLNARNILLSPELERVILIDYANYGVGHVVKDTAKLEADCIFSVLDGKNDKFYDWNRIGEWRILFDLLVIENVFNFEQQIDIEDLEIKKIYNFVKNLRKVLKEIVYPQVETVEYQYLKYQYLKSLLYYSFHYLTYPDISIQKKVFAIEWIYQIITQLKNSYVRAA